MADQQDPRPGPAAPGSDPGDLDASEAGADLQKRKMEAVGRLASGVAHDFRNLLMALQGCLALAERSLHNPAVARQYIGEAQEATRKGTRLTDQLLAFSRRKPVDQVPVRLPELVRRSEGVLRPLLGETIALRFDLDDGPAVRAGADEVEQVLLNLVANARDAMPNGGEVRILVRTVDARTPSPAATPNLPPGRYVELGVADDGHGMSAETRSRIFEPFSTTKGVGEGTGLGLATVYGTVRRLGGDIVVDSQEGVGTTFRLFLPALDEDAPSSSSQPPPPPLAEAARASASPVPPGAERVLRVLLVEDDEMVRMTVRHYLELGHQDVVEARDARHAVELVEREGDRLDVLVTDMVMPAMGGRELARYVAARVPGIRVLYMSAHPRVVLSQSGRLDPGIPLLYKPFDGATLLRALSRAKPIGPERGTDGDPAAPR